MRRLCNVLFFLALSIVAFGQNGFPDKYIGVWRGNLSIYNADAKVTMEVPMELHIDTTDKDSVWKWQIHYTLSERNDIRKYLLKLDDRKKGEYSIDEENGIVLTAQLFDNTLISRFSVQNNLLLIKYAFSKDSVYVEIISGKEDEKKKTGDIEEKEIPAVYNYRFSNYQKATLFRKEN